MNSDNRNLVLAMILSVGFLVLYNHFFADKFAPPQQLPAQIIHQVVEVFPREEALKQDKRIAIKTPKFQGSINLKGGRFDDLELTSYKQEVKEGSPSVVLLSPRQTKNGYLIECGWLGENQGLFPDGETLWEASSTKLSPETPVVLSWKNEKGILFQRTIEVDENYLFKVSEKVTNTTEESFDVMNWALISRIGLPETSDYMVLHEGAVGVINGKLKELTYKNLKESATAEQNATGWFGFTDKYWLTSLIPQENVNVAMEIKAVQRGGKDIYQVEYKTPKVALKAGESHQIVHRIFAGAKVVTLLDAYEKNEKISRFDLAVDFGWFYFLTKPLFYVMEILNNFIGNFGWAIIILTVLTKIVLFPLARTSYNSMNKMKLLQPEMDRLKVKYENDKMMMQQELMAFYKKNNINPLAGCLPMIPQFFLGFALYKVLFVSIEMRHAPFFGWIQDLSAQDPTSVFNLFGLLPFDPPTFLMIGLWPIINGATMFLQQKMSPQPSDPAQAKMMMLMPIFFIYLMSSFPVGLVIYWSWSSILTIAQQWVQGKMMQEKGA